ELRLGFLIHDVSRLRRSAFDRCLKPLNVTRSQWWVLAYLSREDGMTQSQLAEELDLGKVAVGGLIDRLEKSGLVRRDADATDRRTPDKPALVAYRADRAEPTRLSYRELADKVALAAGGLRRLGVGPGDIVALQVPNWWEFVVTSLACGRIGAVVNPLMPIFRE